MGITFAKTAEMILILGNKHTLSLNDFRNIENKVFIGLADKDNMVALEETTAFYKQLKNGSMFMLPNTKHPIETVNVNLLASIISDFFAVIEILRNMKIFLNISLLKRIYL